jgi:hypothetical protein
LSVLSVLFSGIKACTNAFICFSAPHASHDQSMCVPLFRLTFHLAAAIHVISCCLFLCTTRISRSLYVCNFIPPHLPPCSCNSRYICCDLFFVSAAAMADAPHLRHAWFSGTRERINASIYLHHTHLTTHQCIFFSAPHASYDASMHLFLCTTRIS